MDAQRGGAAGKSTDGRHCCCPECASPATAAPTAAPTAPAAAPASPATLLPAQPVSQESDVWSEDAESDIWSEDGSQVEQQS